MDAFPADFTPEAIRTGNIALQPDELEIMREMRKLIFEKCQDHEVHRTAGRPAIIIPVARICEPHTMWRIYRALVNELQPLNWSLLFDWSVQESRFTVIPHYER